MAAENAVLSQREIDALLRSDPDAAPAPQRGAMSAPTALSRRVKPYDFRHPEKLSKEQLRSLQIIQQGVATALAANLSARLRAPVEAKLSSIERSIYEEYTSQIGANSVLAFIDMAPLQGYAIAAFGLDVGYSIIDRLLGGRGIRPTSIVDRDLSDIEAALIRHVASDISRALVEPWGRITELTPEVAEVATASSVVQVVPPSEFVIVAWYEVRYAEQTGGISICFPFTVLEQVIPSLTGHSLFESRIKGGDGEQERVSSAHLLPATVSIRAMLGEGRVAASDIAALAEGDVIILDREVDEPLRMFVGNNERYAATPGTSGRRLALQIAGLVDEDGFITGFPEEEAKP